MIVDLPLTNFIGDGKELIERLYALPDENDKMVKRDDYEVIMDLPTIKGYNPTRVDKPSYIWSDELAPIFGDRQICIFSQEYKVFEELKDHITQVVEKSGGVAFTVKNTDYIALVDSINEFMVELFEYNDYSWKDFVIWNTEKDSELIMDWRDRSVKQQNTSIAWSSEE